MGNKESESYSDEDGLSTTAGQLVAKVLLDPVYGVFIRSEINNNIAVSKGITATTSDFIAMAKAISASRLQLNNIASQFKTLENRRASTASAQDILTFITNVVEILDLGKQTGSAIIGKIVSAIPLMGQIQTSAQAIAKVLKSLNIAAEGLKLGLTTSHFYGLPNSTRTGMGKAYNPAFVARALGFRMRSYAKGATVRYMQTRVAGPASLGKSAALALSDFNTAIDTSIIPQLQANDFDAFSTTLNTTVLPASKRLDDGFSKISAAISAGNNSVSKPVNYDLLLLQAKEAYSTYVNKSLQFTLGITSATLGVIIDPENYISIRSELINLLVAVR